MNTLKTIVALLALSAYPLNAQDDQNPFRVDGVDPGYYSVFPAQTLEYHMENHGLELEPGENTVRFLWIRSFHPTILFVVEPSSETTAKFKASELKDDEWKVFSEVTMPLERHLKQLARITDSHAFFSLPNFVNRQGLDGSSWIIDIRHQGEHHWINRWSPKSDDPAWIIGTDLIGLSINSPSVPIY